MRWLLPARATLLVCVLLVPACRERERERERVPLARDAAPLPVDAATDAAWRKPDYLGNLSDIQHLLDRDCPPDTPPMDGRGYGRRVNDAGFDCAVKVRPGVWRVRMAGTTPGGQTPDVTSVSVGYLWKVGQPVPTECDRALEEELLEYYRALVRTPGTGAPPPLADERALQHALLGDPNENLETSTGPLAVRASGGCEWTLYGFVPLRAWPKTSKPGANE